MSSDAARGAFERSHLGKVVLASRPFPTRPAGFTARLDLSWQKGATRCREADETTSYVMVEAEYQDDIGKEDLAHCAATAPSRSSASPLA